ncbi:MAG: MotA/TolQ/ExbB proton channel family protein [Bacteroidales bacterium]|nr:MotA/TolQ/ExbB proton channel family protein [Bacteroidales bacterium]
MKKVLALFAILGFLFLGVNISNAQTPPDEGTDTIAQVDTNVAVNQNTPQDDLEVEAADTETGIHTVLKTKFIEGGAGFMGIVLIALILGLAIALERIIYLTLASTDTTKFIKKVEAALENDGVEGAKEICRNTRGPIASIYYQGLSRYDQGVEVVEKAVLTYGSVQMGLLEKGLTWVAFFIAVAPMLGFMGTVIGMISAFDAIEKAGDINAGLVASGIKIALLTTVFGLIVAIILQVFYNYITSRIDGIVNKMEDASVTLIDMLMKHQLKNK